MAVLGASPTRAQLLPLQLNTGNHVFSLSPSVDLNPIVDDLPSPLPLNPNITIALNIDLPSGYPLQSRLPHLVRVLDLVKLGGIR